jgi:hypothetical protein
MDITGFLKALGTVAASHTLGHLDAAGQSDAGDPKLRGMHEYWNRPPDESNQSGGWKNSLLESDRNAAGFTTQDKVNQAIDTPESNAANALYKGVSLISNGDLGGKGVYSGGDFGGMKENSGNNHTKEMVAATAIFDAIKALKPEVMPEWMRDGDLSLTTIGSEYDKPVSQRGFASVGGTPGVVFTKKW